MRLECVNSLSYRENKTFNGKIYFLTKNMSKLGVDAFVRKERILSEFAEKQKYNFFVNKLEDLGYDILEVSIIDSKKNQKAPEYIEKLSSYVFDCESKTESENMKNIYAAMRKLADAWKNKTPYEEKSFIAKTKYLWGLKSKRSSL